MKIIPQTENWNEGECDWSFVKNATDDITAWEHRECLVLPDEYRQFMIRYNGGSVYPRLITFAGDSSETFVDRIFSWKTVESHWKGETYGRGTPPGYLIFADTPGPIQFLISVKPEDYGRIYSWVHSTDIWGTDRNTEIFPQSNTFREFLNGLYDDDQGSDFENWHLPIYDSLMRELEIPLVK
jgi:hypothetical protein